MTIGGVPQICRGGVAVGDAHGLGIREGKGGLEGRMWSIKGKLTKLNR